jgi:U3 small nucleolar RNA-associated protein 12
MVKAYLRYEPALSFGVIVSPQSNVVYDPSGRRLLAAALDRFAAWDLKRGLPSATFTPSSSSASLGVSCIASSPSAASASASSVLLLLLPLISPPSFAAPTF